MPSWRRDRPRAGYGDAAGTDSEAAIGEVVANAFRAAESPRPGAAFVALPNDTMNEPASECILTPVGPARTGAAATDAIAEAARLINQAKAPVLLFGMLANEPRPATAARELLSAVPFAGDRHLPGQRDRAAGVGASLRQARRAGCSPSVAGKGVKTPHSVDASFNVSSAHSS